MTLKVLIVEDEKHFRNRLYSLLRSYGEIDAASSFEEALEWITKKNETGIPYDVALIDLNLNGSCTGLMLLPYTKKLNTYSIILTNHDDDKYIKEAYKSGADHYFTKDNYEIAVNYVISNISLKNEPSKLDALIKDRFITSDEKLKSDIFSLKQRVVKSRPVLILGETGTGKSELAKIIHSMVYSDKNCPFIEMNMSAIPESLAESELFGHSRGSFSGAVTDLKGKFELANNGTLFLDEIGTASIDVQKKLLKAIEEKKFYPIGKTLPTECSFNLISATQDDIFEKIKNNSFRLDLFYRINSIVIDIPPLRKRKKDIELIVKHLLKKNPRKITIDDLAMEQLIEYSWPGNVRELKSTIDDFFYKENGFISLNDLPTHIREPINSEVGVSFIPDLHIAFLKKNGYKAYMKKIEMEVVKNVLEISSNKVSMASNISGISIPYLYKIMRDIKNEKAIYGNSNQ